MGRITSAPGGSCCLTVMLPSLTARVPSGRSGGSFPSCGDTPFSSTTSFVAVRISFSCDHFTCTSPTYSLWNQTVSPTTRSSLPERWSPFSKTRVSGAASGALVFPEAEPCAAAAEFVSLLFSGEAGVRARKSIRNAVAHMRSFPKTPGGRRTIRQELRTNRARRNRSVGLLRYYRRVEHRQRELSALRVTSGDPAREKDEAAENRAASV